MWSWWIAAFAAPGDGEPATEDTYTIPPLDAELPSALQTGELEAGEDDGSLAAALTQFGFDTDDFGRPRLVRGGWFVRPRFAISHLFTGTKGPSALRIGLSAGRRFWTIEALPIQLAADLGLRFTAPVGGAKGRRLEGFANVGPWLGPARIQVGLGARWEREFWGAHELADALHLGPQLQIAVDVGLFQANVGWMPSWRVWGDRDAANTGAPVFPTLAHETTWSAGLAAPVGPFRLGADASWRDTSVGGLFEVGLILGIDLTAFRQKKKETDAPPQEDAP